ncbi:hypothetical protein RCH13_000563 [Chryseobacterium sp. MP_3.2]|nr:hypothetical protein [Chryseobacterium sp. MP_3.2]
MTKLLTNLCLNLARLLYNVSISSQRRYDKKILKFENKKKRAQFIENKATMAIFKYSEELKSL